MNPVFKKLNFRDQPEILVVNAPESFEAILEEMSSVTSVKIQLEQTTQLLFALAFVTKQQEVDAISKQFAEKLADDGIIWFAYPKGSSKRYKCEFNRDNGWEVLGKEGFEPVRMVAIDEDWSALRFRRTNFIKTMTRSRALSDEGKVRISKT